MLSVSSRGPRVIEEHDVEIRWSASEQEVGLFIRGELWAVFDVAAQTKHGGDYRPGTHPEPPAAASVGFRPTS